MNTATQTDAKLYNFPDERGHFGLYGGRFVAEELVERASAFLPKDPNENKDARREIEYLNKNKEHMRYAHFRKQGLFIGSGVIEAACKNLAGKRLKQSGMEWTVSGANAIIALRCATLSKSRFQDYWDARAA